MAIAQAVKAELPDFTVVYWDSDAHRIEPDALPCRDVIQANENPGSA